MSHCACATITTGEKSGARDGAARQNAIDKIIADSQARLKEEDAMRLRKGDLEEDIDRDLPIHNVAEWARARTATGGRARQEDEQIIRERTLLGRLGQSFNREVDRCCWRLDSVPTETLQWLASITATGPSGMPFGRKGKEASMSKYRSVGHCYLSCCWRLYRIGREEAL
ncbi:uncharacterized protein BKA55DRAFT_742558 [Fusarium redolens]|uniref:Uncharacterized protein n=1 Tax=Fusarium redolens TaxID=48865 RepID=A0A9P9G657_FUSRE|nr:uncharacterized protein BKA55DRAFT_742558 [Fusarium redolens]KAH7233815.1 hypothetical protein BKA55DRAFT_742558 [Fusarium redolens]